MIVRSLIERKDGSVVRIEDKEYHFKPDKNGVHVCEIPKNHLKYFEDVPEGYEVITGDSKK